MLTSMNFARKAASAICVSGLMALPVMAQADQIILTSPDQTVRLQGTFVAFDVNAYVIEINGYELRVAAAQMQCAGVDCMDFEPVLQGDGNS